MLQKRSHDFDVIIVGAGPSGCAAALALRHSGLRVALLDKSRFPRHKTCGDAIPAPTIKYLKQLLPEAETDWQMFINKQQIQSDILQINSKKIIEVKWVLEAFNCKRIDFDYFTLQLVEKYTSTEILTGEKVKDFKNIEPYLEIITSENQYTCKMLIACDGANSIFANRISAENKPNFINGFAVSAYYQNIALERKENYLFLLRNIQGYFWLFPTGNDTWNAGFGILKKNKNTAALNVKQQYEDLLQNEPEIRSLFTHATQLSEIKGFSLPFGGTKNTIAKDRILLAGDSARLIDVMGGHGIDKAVLSGKLAAEHVLDCIAKQDISKQQHRKYEEKIHAEIGKTLRQNLRLLYWASTFNRLIFNLVNILILIQNIKGKPISKKYSFYNLK